MELRHLRYFVATAEAQSLTKAALALHIAQPPLGQQIRALEEEIGTPLFHRQGRGIVLSDAGKAFLVCARDILARAEEAKGRALRAARGEIGTLTLGFTESASFNEGMTALLHLYQQRYRQVQINLVEGNSETLVGRLLERQIDAAIVRPPFAGGCDLAFQILSEEPLMVVLPDGHPLLARDRLDLADLRDERFILYSRKSGYGLSAEIVSACRAQGFSPRIHQQAPQVSSAVNLVSAGMGVALVPASMQRMARPGLNFRQLALEHPRATLGLATLAQTPSAVVDGLLQCAREVLAGG
ncbi:LysR family transcriptional regulator [Pseudomonas sp. L5B5]|uniref:LysR family transcriptional regulator n=1 Tax=Pseudomonas sp. L5B5 TaxID=2883205 RepID=UPI001CFBA81A|nr:LysR family transcriptional regulator [Pseudomonas sp. L5B5]UCZ85440.1 LysR family transcriptional regulator [Pseudomonas sp. L5B5]